MGQKWAGRIQPRQMQNCKKLGAKKLLEPKLQKKKISSKTPCGLSEEDKSLKKRERHLKMQHQGQSFLRRNISMKMQDRKKLVAKSSSEDNLQIKENTPQNKYGLCAKRLKLKNSNILRNKKQQSRRLRQQVKAIKA